MSQQARITVTRRGTIRPEYQPTDLAFCIFAQLVTATKICGQRSGLTAYGINPLVFLATHCGRQVEEVSEPV